MQDKKLYFEELLKTVFRFIALPVVLIFFTLHYFRDLITFVYYYLSGGGEFINYKTKDRESIYKIYEKLKKQEEQTEDFKQRGY